MNKQIKLVRCVCVAGIAGLLAAGGAGTNGSIMTFAEGLAAEEGQVILLTPENIEVMKTKLQEDPDIVITLEDGTPIDLEYLESLEASGESVILKKSDIAENPGLLEALGYADDGEAGGSGTSEIPENQEASDVIKVSDTQDGLDTPEILGDLENSEVSDGAGMSENPESSDHVGNVENPSEPGTPENPMVSENPETPENSENPGTPGESGTPGTPETSGEPGTPKFPEASGEPGNSETPEVPENQENSDNSGTPKEPGNSEDSGTSKEPGSSDNSGTLKKPGSSDNSGTSKRPGLSGNSGASKEPGESEMPEVPGTSKKPGESDISKDPATPTTPNDSANPDNPNESEDPDVSDQPGMTENPENPDMPGDPDETENPNDQEVPDVSEDLNILDYVESSDPEGKDFIEKFSKRLDEIIVDADQFQPEQITPEKISNAAVYLNRELVKLPKIVEDYRFWTVTRKYAFAKEDIMIREKIPAEEVGEEMVRAVGSLEKDGLLYILKEEDNGWLYVESGRVRGFVRSEKVITGSEANQLLETYQNEAKQKAEEQQIEYTGIEDTVSMAKELVPWRDNEAFTYLRATVNQTVVEKRYAVAKNALVEVKEDKDAASRVVGVLPSGGLCYILDGVPEDKDIDEAIDGNEAVSGAVEEAGNGAVNGTVGKAGNGAVAVNRDGNVENINGAETGITEGLSGEPEKVAANEAEEISEKGTEEESEKGTEEESQDEATGEPENGTANESKNESQEEEEEQDWIYIESGDVRGFVWKDSISYGEDITKQVEEAKEDSYSLAETKIKPEENKACYYTLTSTKSGIPSGEIRKSMIEFAAQFIGNPYVWGGTSLTDGADCSGFVQSIYKQYGYDLPRVACDQAEYGVKIPVEDALPGDLIFYSKNGYIHHVVMYAGGGKTIEAMSTKMGIVQADVRTDSAVWATRILDDNGYEYAGGSISDVNTTPDMYGTDLGTFELTYYCSCELCCDVETGITATGAPVVEGRTIAVDPSVIPYGTQVIIGGHLFTAEDCGGAIKGNHIDIYVNDHAKALALGVNYANVYLRK